MVPWGVVAPRRPRRVLAVDDDPAIRRMLGRALSQVYEIVVLCSDGEVALEEIRRVCPDLVLLDLSMPVLDGWRLLEILEQDGCDVPVLLMSGECLREWPRSPLVRGRFSKTDGLAALLAACQEILGGAPPSSAGDGG